MSTPELPSGIPHQRAQPLEHRQLDGRRARAAGPRAGERVDARGGRVGERADVGARAADAREEAAGGRRADPTAAPARTASRAPAPRRRARRAAGRRSPPAAHPALPTRIGGASPSAFGVRDEPVDDRVAEPAHLLGRERERFGHPPCNSSPRSTGTLHRTGFRRERGPPDVAGIEEERHGGLSSDAGYRMLFEASPLPTWVYDAETLRVPRRQRRRRAPLRLEPRGVPRDADHGDPPGVRGRRAAAGHPRRLGRLPRAGDLAPPAPRRHGDRRRDQRRAGSSSRAAPPRSSSRATSPSGARCRSGSPRPRRWRRSGAWRAASRTTSTTC